MKPRFSLFVSAFLALSMAPVSDLRAEPQRVYFGTYTTGDSSSRGIYTSLFDAATGRLSEPELAAESVNPSFLAIHPNGRYLYAVNEVVEGSGRGNAGVSAYRIEADGKLTFLVRRESLGGAPCHANVDATGKYLLIANYVGGNLVVFPVLGDDGLGEPSCVIEHTGSSVDPQRQRQPHAHSINLSGDNRFAYAADLGIDQIRIYRFDESRGLLEPADPAFAAVTAGGGPRHFAIHPSGRFAFTNHELTAQVTSFTRDPETGGLTPVATLPTLPPDFGGRRSTAECLVHPGGEFLYVSNRGHDSIAAYRIDTQSGGLQLLEIVATEGAEPRNFFIEPSGRWLLAANQNSDTVAVFEIDPRRGTFRYAGQKVGVGRPVCIRMLPTGR